MHHMSHITSPEIFQSIIMLATVPPLRYYANDKIGAYFSERYKQIIAAIMRPLRSRIKAASRLVSVPRNPSGVRSRENREKTSLAFGCRSSAISRTKFFLSLYRFLLFSSRGFKTASNLPEGHRSESPAEKKSGNTFPGRFYWIAEPLTK